MYTYCIQIQDNLVKIGKSKHPEKRLKEIQRTYGRQANLLAFTDSISESELHYRLSDYRINDISIHGGTELFLLPKDTIIEEMPEVKLINTTQKIFGDTISIDVDGRTTLSIILKGNPSQLGNDCERLEAKLKSEFQAGLNMVKLTHKLAIKSIMKSLDQHEILIKKQNNLIMHLHRRTKHLDTTIANLGVPSGSTSNPAVPSFDILADTPEMRALRQWIRDVRDKSLGSPDDKYSIKGELKLTRAALELSSKEQKALRSLVQELQRKLSQDDI